VNALLEAHEITVRFGGVTANDRVSLDIREGERVGVIGPNGAGKTTFIDAITGFVRSSGRVMLDGSELSERSAAARVRAGMTRTWQSVELFDDLTIVENLDVAAHQVRRFDLMREVIGLRPRPDRERTTRILDLVGMLHAADAYPDELSNGQRKLAGIARALATGPRILCLDEPAAGLDERESAELGARLRQLTADGITLLLVDHDMELVFSACDRILVLDQGRTIAMGTPDEVRNHPEVLRAYLGTDHREAS
jgi:branched-chain amino acid transport system ATP-binding protein